MFSTNDYSVDGFFNSFRDVLGGYTTSQEDGQFTVVACSTQQNREKLFQLRINGFCPIPFAFSSEELDSYLDLQNNNNNLRNQLFDSFENKIIDLLNETGYGEVKFIFKRGSRNQLIVFSYLTFSERMILYL